jgi:hypothetical protein
VNRSYDPLQPSRLAFHVSRIVIDAGVLLVLGAMSLPFVTAESFHQRSMAGDGLPALLLVLPIFLMTLLPDQSTPLPTPLAWVSLGLLAAALPYTVVKYLDASTLAGTLKGAVGMGARVLVMGTFLVLAGLVLGLIRPLFGAPEPEPGRADPSRVPTPSPGAPATSRAATSPAGAPAPAARAPAAAPAGRSFPRWRRPGAARAAAPAVPPSPSPATQRPPARVPPRPRPADPDTEPTLPAQRPVQPWFPDDLDDLFS